MPDRWWQSLFRRLPKPRRYEWSAALHTLLDNLAQVEQRPQDQIHEDLISSGLANRASGEGRMRLWEKLTAREQQVVALVCLGFTNRQIAGRLGVSRETVKSHVRRVLSRVHASDRAELRVLFSDWDFSDWDR